MCSRQIGGFPEGVEPFGSEDWVFGSVRKTGCSVRFGRLGVRFGSEDWVSGSVRKTGCSVRKSLPRWGRLRD